MLLVKTRLGASPIEGIGLFAAEDIPKGTKMWVFHHVVDYVLTEKAFDCLSPPTAEQFKKYSYFDYALGAWILCGDDARFWNHSEVPNCEEHGMGREGTTVAGQDIKEGDELTIDYRLIHSGALDF